MTAVTFRSTDGLTLSGDLLQPDQEPVGGAVVCHPHPQYGGSMDTWMPPVLQQALADDGWLALRFDFRGVGRSEGSYGGGVDEVEDVVGAIDFLVGQLADAAAPILLAGWSFGSMVSLRAALRDDRVSGWFGVAPPVSAGDLLPELDPADLEAWDHPTCWVIGERDQITSVDQVRDVAAHAPQHEVVVLGGDHFLLGKGDELGRRVRDLGRTVREG